jgi:hypothetical protein
MIHKSLNEVRKQIQIPFEFELVHKSVLQKISSII